MIDLNALIHAHRENISPMVTKMNNSEYFVDGSFQRKLIWTEPQKIRLIETVLMGFPMPEIYLWEQATEPTSGDQKFSIVDGQQRLTSLQQFIAGEWPLKSKSLDKENKDSAFANKHWNELAPKLKSRIWEYRINIRVIPTTVDKSTIHKIFTRLNQTDKSLNPQEMRNAQFHGEFIKASVEVADAINGKQWNIFSNTDIRRMKDIEYASQLMSYLIRGISGTTPSELNDLYDTYNDVFKAKRKNITKAKTILDKIEKAFSDDTIKTFFSKSVHFYTLFAVLDILEVDISKRWKEKLKKFVQTYEAQDFDQPVEDTLLVEYKKGSSYTTAGKKSRERRIYSLIDFLAQA